MTPDELAKEIAATTRVMQMQSSMVDALHAALIIIAYDKPSDPAQTAVEALARYAQIFETYKAKKAGAA